MPVFNARTYWPQPAIGRTLTNTFSSGIVQTYVTTDEGSVVYRQVINGAWDSDWYYRISPTGDVLEYRDDYPRKRWLDYLWFWRKNRQVWCLDGREIYWGCDNLLTTQGVSITRPCETRGLLGQLGVQELGFYDVLPMCHTAAGLFHDVLVMEYWQQWSGGKISGAKMWMAPGIGTIAAEWSLDRKPTGYSAMIQKSEWS